MFSVTSQTRRFGSSLLIVLAMLLLMSALVMAFFTAATTERTVARSFSDFGAVSNTALQLAFNTGGSPLMVGQKQGLETAKETFQAKLEWFEIAVADGKFAGADAVIDGDSVVVSSPEVPAPTQVRYAWATNPEGCNLYSKAGLPA
jgi:type II secretory pathway pseudopilin PulG